MKHLKEYIYEAKEEKRDAKKALWEYAEGLTTGITHELRKGRCSKEAKEDAKLISSLMTTKKFDKLYRCTDWSLLKNYWKLNKKNISGAKIVDNGFVSTSPNIKSCFELYPEIKDTILLHITSDKPFVCLDMGEALGDDNPFPSQTEILLDRGYTFEFGELRESEKYYEIDVKVTR